MAIKCPSYTQFPNEVIDEMPNLSGSELKVITAIIRATLGFHRQCAKLSINDLRGLTGLSDESIRQALRGLIERDWVERNQEADGSVFWLKLEYGDGAPPKRGGSKNLTPGAAEGVKKFDPQGSKNLTPGAAEGVKKFDPSFNKCISFKETLLKKGEPSEKKTATPLEEPQRPPASLSNSESSSASQQESRTGGEDSAAALDLILTAIARLSVDQIPPAMRNEWRLKKMLPWRDISSCRVLPDFAAHVGKQISFSGAQETMHPRLKGERHIEGLELSCGGFRSLVTYWEVFKEKNLATASAAIAADAVKPPPQIVYDPAAAARARKIALGGAA